jgi:NAD(P)-dependent dehydrogenase (short-subunit alcohol dehydrogenase family)
MARWTATDIPPQTGRTAVVTGTGGIGFEVALALARAGASVVLAGRNSAKGDAAVAQIRGAAPAGQVRFEALDLASLGSIAAFAQRMRARETRLDLLVNNAGVMVPPHRQQTADGFELQLGTNHLGHFALTAALMPLLGNGDAARMVCLSSIAARQGAIDFDDLNATRRYRPMPAYAQSKLACLMFALEFDRRSVAGGWGVRGSAAHPGVARTDLLHNAPGRRSPAGIARSLLWFLFQPAAQGALPTLFAATSPEARGSGYYGPDRWGELRGHPTAAAVPQAATDRTIAARLWEESERLTGATF